MHSLVEFVRILRPAERRRLGLLLVGITIAAIVDVAGIASIGPFLALVASPATSTRVIAELRTYTGVTDDRTFVALVGCLSLALVTLSNFLNAWSGAAQVYFSNSLGVTLARRLLDGYLSQDQVVLSGRNSTELGKNILSEVDRVMTGVTMPAMIFIARSATAILIVVFLMLIDPILAALLALAFGGAYVIVYLAVKRRLATVGKAALEGNNQRFRIVTEAFGALRELRLYGRLDAFVGRFDRPAWAYANANATSLVIGQLPRYVMEPLVFGGMVFTVIYVIKSGGDLAAVGPVVGMFAFAGYRLMPAFQHLFSSFSTIRVYLPSLKPVLDGLAAGGIVRADESETSFVELPFTDKLALEKVSFAYPDGSQILDKLDLAIAANSTVGIIGRTGAGKSTLLSIILGLVTPSSGRITADGVPLASNRQGWQRHLGYVPQDVFLVDDSIAANIAFGVPAERIDRGAVERAARLAHIDTFVNGLPARYETIVGERGTRLSGGQRQRIGIARALYHDPDVIVFDEATSGLDNETEEALMTAIDDLAGHRTLIIIAHRPTTLRRADVVHLLEGGRIIASGPVGQFATKFGIEDVKSTGEVR